MKIKSQKQLEAKLAALGQMDDEQKKSVVCSLIGHSKIQTQCFGYYYCGRCGDQLGDTLASVYPEAENAVVVGHGCDTCHANFKECDWRDTFLAPNPFKSEQAA